MTKQITEQCHYLGKPYPIYLEVDPKIVKTDIAWDNEAFICSVPSGVEKIDFAGLIKSFYVREGRKLIGQRLKHYQHCFKVKYKSFSIEDSLIKWGSCSSKRILTFHWKLMFFPIEVIDYVVVHELCHLIHMNHDRSFWRLVGKIYPDYKEAMAMLGTKKRRDI
jgi:hypothetical protein